MPNSSTGFASIKYRGLSDDPEPVAVIGAPGAIDRGGLELVLIGLAASIFVHLALLLWAFGPPGSGPKISQDDAILVQLVPAEKALPHPRSPPEAARFEPEKAASKSEATNAPGSGQEQQNRLSSSASNSVGKMTSVDPTKLTKEELDKLIAQAMFCWSAPAGWADRGRVSVTVRFFLNRDGTLKGRPVVVEFPASVVGQAAADNAVSAVLRCSPFALPVEKYEQWKDVQLQFRP